MSEDAQPEVVPSAVYDEQVLAEYRGLLVKTAQDSQNEFDKTVLALSGGALGLSVAFVKDLVGPRGIYRPGWLLAAWIFWGLSSTAILLSFYSSHRALRRALTQLDSGALTASEKLEQPGGWCDTFTAWMNFGGLISFILGLAMMITFLCFNWWPARNPPYPVPQIDAPSTQPDASADKSQQPK